jgi:hypothetical protein
MTPNTNHGILQLKWIRDHEPLSQAESAKGATLMHLPLPGGRLVLDEFQTDRRGWLFAQRHKTLYEQIMQHRRREENPEYVRIPATGVGQKIATTHAKAKNSM